MFTPCARLLPHFLIELFALQGRSQFSNRESEQNEIEVL